jgi:hypothetical protein
MERLIASGGTWRYATPAASDTAPGAEAGASSAGRKGSDQKGSVQKGSGRGRRGSGREEDVQAGLLLPAIPVPLGGRTGQPEVRQAAASGRRRQRLCSVPRRRAGIRRRLRPSGIAMTIIDASA